MNQTLPASFLERGVLIFGERLFRDIQPTFIERPTTLRVNDIKASKHENIKTTLVEQGFKLQSVSWYTDAYILLNKSKRELTETDVYKDGKIYIQSLASMVPPLVLDPQPGERVLDLTAAPGSKTSQIAALMGCVGELVANDNNRVRFFKLKHNLETLGVAAENDGWIFRLRMEHGAKLCQEYREYFDKILLDAPCSAEARFVVDEPRTHGYWSERKIKEMAYKQRQLLLSAWGALKPGGTLVYSTCTFAPEENELQISRLFERYSDARAVDIRVDDLKIVPPLKKWKDKDLHAGVAKAIRILPTKEIEGFFVAKIKKQS
ncbi:MAG: RsmB/NOP family class I SAM-dependent RNA methyltransferase [Candidatus Magasanikbacteria bacterium]|nr:RsmB/NOP family class I SAM-dependent RNA methyltransferase [Candidatus Magasanikbacteria bacterium]